MKIRIKSLFLASIVALSMSGCTLHDSSNFTSIEDSSYEQVVGQNDLQSRMISFIEKIENSDIGLDLTHFYNNALTLQIITDEGKELHYNSFYDKDANTLVINIMDEGAFEHELVHVIMNDGKELGSVFLEEGLTELISSEVCDTQSVYAFNVGVCKILTSILGKETMVEVINKKDLNIIIDGLSSVAGNREDAVEFLNYAEYEHYLLNKMHEVFYTTGNFDEFIQSDDYVKLQNVRKYLVGRLISYVQSYYAQQVQVVGIDVEQLLTDMLSCLIVINDYMYDGNVDLEKSNEFFLVDHVSYLVNTYQISDDVYNRCYKEAFTKKYIYFGRSSTMDLH